MWRGGVGDWDGDGDGELGGSWVWKVISCLCGAWQLLVREFELPELPD